MQLIRLAIFNAACLMLLSTQVSAISTAFCAQNPQASYVEIAFNDFAKSNFDKRSPGRIEHRRYQAESIFYQKKATAADDFSILVGVNYQYETFNFELFATSEPQTNGDLHTLAMPVHWIQSSSNKQLRISLAPAIATSSNRFNNPGQLKREDLQLWFALQLSRQISNQFEWLYGLCADQRFGQYRAYPIFGAIWKPTGAWTIRLVYPDPAIIFNIKPQLKLDFSIAPDGNQWHVYNKGLSKDSSFQREAWRAETRLTWQITSSIAVSSSLGRQFSQHLRFINQNDLVIATDIDNSSYWTLSLRWTFP